MERRRRISQAWLKGFLQQEGYNLQGHGNLWNTNRTPAPAAGGPFVTLHKVQMEHKGMNVGAQTWRCLFDLWLSYVECVHGFGSFIKVSMFMSVIILSQVQVAVFKRHASTIWRSQGGNCHLLWHLKDSALVFFSPFVDGGSCVVHVAHHRAITAKMTQ